VADHPTFEYVVYGRPVSIQPKPRAPGGKPKKSAALPAWREEVKRAFRDAWRTKTNMFSLLLFGWS